MPAKTSTLRPFLMAFALWIASIAMSSAWWQIRLDHDDQALFRLGSEILRAGGTLYSDIWDLKQPGIYWYYQLSERLFGPGPVSAGVHIATSIWLATAAVLGAYIAKWSVPEGRQWVLAPILTLLVYVCRVDVYTLAQVEAIIALPMLALIACVTRAAATKHPRKQAALYTSAGALTGVIAVFKLVLLAIPATIILIAFLQAWRRRRRDCLAAFTWSALGFLLIVLATAWPFIEDGSWRLFLWTQFVFPAEAVMSAEVPPVRKLFVSGSYLASTVLLLLPAALIGSYRLAKSKQPESRLAAYACLSWIVVGLIAIVVQRFSWHAYHFTMLFWPIGLLATCGLSWPRRGPRDSKVLPRKGVLLKVSTACAILGMIVNVARFAHWQLAPPQPEFNSSTYLDSLPTLKDYRTTHDCRSAIVFGSPVLLHALEIEPVSPLTGQLSIILLPRQWDELMSTLSERRPQYIYIAERQRPVLEQRAPHVLAWVTESYAQIASDAVAGTWYGYSGQRDASSCESVVTVLQSSRQ